MSDEMKQDDHTPEEKPAYTPASRGKRIAALIGAIVVIVLVLMYSYSLATGSFLWS